MGLEVGAHLRTHAGSAVEVLLQQRAVEQLYSPLAAVQGWLLEVQPEADGRARARYRRSG